MNPWILRRCRKQAAVVAALWTLTLLGALAFAWSQSTYCRDFLQGPYTASAQFLASVGSPDKAPHQWLAVTSAKPPRYTGIDQVETPEDDPEATPKVVARYYGTVVGGRLLVVKSAYAPGATFQGAIEDLPPGVDSRLQQALGPGASSQYYPFLIDTAPFRTPGYIALAFFAVLLLLMVKFGWRGLRRALQPQLHPVYQRVAQWGDPEAMSEEIVNDALEHPRIRVEAWRLGDRYAVRSGFAQFNVLRWQDALWVYPKTVKRRIWGLIPAGKSWWIVVHCYGGNLEARAKQQKVTEAMDFVAERAPWVLRGWSKEREQLWMKNRTGFCQAVEQLRNPSDMHARPHR